MRRRAVTTPRGTAFAVDLRALAATAFVATAIVATAFMATTSEARAQGASSANPATGAAPATTPTGATGPSATNAATAGGSAAGAVPATLGDDARVAGEGRFTFLGQKVYDARLWIGRGFDARKPIDAPFALELTYLRRFEGRAIAERSLSEIDKLGVGTAAQRAAWLAELQRLMPDVAPGDRLTGVWRPGQGTTFLRNERPLGRVDDPSFAHAFFSIWLDPRTTAPALRKALLAGAPGGDEPADGAPRAVR